MNFPLVINVLVFVALLLLLAQTRHKQWSLAKKCWSAWWSAWYSAWACSWCTAPTTRY
ncbi:hypothetical protein M5585_18635 [Serratia ureilytica]